MRHLRLSSHAKAKLVAVVFGGMHTRLNDAYAACECCTLRVGLAPKPDKLISPAFINATEFVYQNKGFSVADLENKKVKAVTKKYYEHFKNAIDPHITHEVPTAMRQKLLTDVFIFSGFKTYTALKEASSLLLDDQGNLKPDHLFKQDILKLDNTYNLLYLEAERQFAISSTQAAAQWASFAADGDRYDLQYRTASDDKVRASHAVLHNITLPIDNPFWDLYFAPNGWRCRCKVVQVRKGKYQVTDTATAMEAGDKATTELSKDGINKLAMFRFNPGKQQVVFPEHHPYAKVAAASLPILQKQAEAETGTGFTIKKEIVTDAALNEVFTDFASEYPEYFERGFKSLKLESKRGNNGSTDMRGNISLTRTRLENVKKGLNNIKAGRETTIDQEDALSTMWHEITHNRNKPGIMRLSKTQTLNMEMANEFVSRNTLPQFMENLGGNLQNEALVTNRDSTGYNTMVRNYQHLIEWSEANKADVVATVQKHLFEESYAVQMTGLVNGIKNNSPYKISQINALLVKARDYPESYFLQILEKEKSSLIKKSR